MKEKTEIKIVAWPDKWRVYITRKMGDNWFSTKVYIIDQTTIIRITSILDKLYFFESSVFFAHIQQALQIEFKLIGKR